MLSRGCSLVTQRNCVAFLSLCIVMVLCFLCKYDNKLKSAVNIEYFKTKPPKLRLESLNTEMPVNLDSNEQKTGFFEEVKPLIVLYTTFKSNNSDIRISNTLHVWAALAPWLKPVLYYTDNRTVKDAAKTGWTAVKCPKIADRISLSCVLPAMFIDAQQRFPTADFYGYANGDLLFDESLFKTLTQINKSLVHSSLLIVGCRYNYQMASTVNPLYLAFPYI